MTVGWRELIEHKQTATPCRHVFKRKMAQRNYSNQKLSRPKSPARFNLHRAFTEFSIFCDDLSQLISNNAPPRRTARQSPRRFPRAPCRSEERRVGNACRSASALHHEHIWLLS